MKDKETQQLIVSILDFARDTKPSEFRLLRTWQDYKLYKNKRTAYKLLVRGLNRTSNRLFKKYCTGVSIGEGNINQLLAYQQLQTTLRFYEHELEVFTDMVYEFEAYLMEGNLVYAFLGIPRTESELWDHREID
jgi:hypothetical protein